MKEDYIPLMQKGGLFEMGLLDATPGDARKCAKNRGTELGVATVTDGKGVEVGNTVDKRLEKAFMKSVKDMETEKDVSEDVMDGEAVEPAKRKVATTPRSPQQTRRSPGTMGRIFRTVRGARCACRARPGRVGTRPGQSR